MTETEMKHYRNAEWEFSLDVPERWNKLPPVSNNSPNEVIRFASHENGGHYCIVFRIPLNPKKTQMEFAESVRDRLSKQEFTDCAISETALKKSGPGLKLDCNRPREDGRLYVREYFIFGETLAHVLGFGTTQWDVAQIDLIERMAQSFVFEG